MIPKNIKLNLIIIIFLSLVILNSVLGTSFSETADSNSYEDKNSQNNWNLDQNNNKIDVTFPDYM